MTKRDFFRIIIKLFGLYALILTIFNYIPSNLNFVTYDFSFISIIWVLIATGLAVLIYVFLILKTDTLIDLLKLDKGFDDDKIELVNFSSQKIIQLALLLIGGFLIIDYFPNFLNYSYLAFKAQVSFKGLNYIDELNFGRPLDYFNWAIATINIIIGYLLLTNYYKLAKWLTRKNR